MKKKVDPSQHKPGQLPSRWTPKGQASRESYRRWREAEAGGFERKKKKEKRREKSHGEQRRRKMGKERGREEQVATVRAVLGDGTPEMDIIRALHMAGDDPTRAINILLDFPHGPPPPPPPSPSPSPSPPAGKPTKPHPESTPPTKTPARSKPAAAAAEKPRPSVAPESTNGGGGGEHWWLVGSVEMAGLSTCKGRRVASGDAVTFSFPNSPVAAAAGGKSRSGRPALVSCSSEIMRFSTPRHGEVHSIHHSRFRESPWSHDFCCCLGRSNPQ